MSAVLFLIARRMLNELIVIYNIRTTKRFLYNADDQLGWADLVPPPILAISHAIPMYDTSLFAAR